MPKGTSWPRILESHILNIIQTSPPWRDWPCHRDPPAKPRAAYVRRGRSRNPRPALHVCMFKGSFRLRLQPASSLVTLRVAFTLLLALCLALRSAIARSSLSFDFNLHFSGDLQQCRLCDTTSRLPLHVAQQAYHSSSYTSSLSLSLWRTTSRAPHHHHRPQPTKDI